ncbi:MAG: slipin family protein [Elusimicrobia bacterium]|nr:slipin family protein [Elusimicrobiota bacterium]
MELMVTVIVLGVVAFVAIMYVRTVVVKPEQVMEWEQGLLFANGRYVRTLGPGRYWLVKAVMGEELVAVDTRLTSLAVPAQEVLTKDKLAVRVTLIAQYRVADAKAAHLKAQSFGVLIYEELQLALRGLVGAYTLDGLFETKEALSTRLTELAAPRLAELGVELRACGVKDVVLPGDLKGIYTKAAEAEKLAQAALVTAREELAAARCQANTAKLIAENPVILRLKELQTLAELAKKPGNSTVVLAAGGEPSLKLK